MEVIRVPQTKFRREFRKWARKVQRHECIVMITLNGVDQVTMLPVGYYEDMLKELNELEMSLTESD